MPTRRQRQVSELIQQEISQLVQRELKDPRLGFITITDVEVTADLRQAHVYVSVLGSKEEQDETMESLKHAEGFLRHELGERLSLRYTPEVHFRADKSLDRGQRILQLLDEIDVEPEDES